MSKPTKIPKNLFPKLTAAGAIVEELGKGSLYSVCNINYGDEAWSIYKGQLKIIIALGLVSFQVIQFSILQSVLLLPWVIPFRSKQIL